MSLLSLQWLQEQVYKVSVSKGWHERDRSYLEMSGMIISEIGELIEACRDPQPSKKIPDHTNVAEEAADILIRILDTCEKFNVSPARFFIDIGDTEKGLDNEENIITLLNVSTERDENSISVDEINPVEFAAMIATGICSSIDESIKGEAGNLHLPFVAFIVQSISVLFYFCQQQEVKLGDAVIAKHYYNMSRPHRHGGKLY